jgi:isoleucyl-tRNA synthetase
VRRSRDRFWSGDNKDAFDTLYTVLETVTRVAAPLIPLIGEEIWQGLTGGRSVHLTDWPDSTLFPADDELVAVMDRVREIASSGLGLRKARSLRVRLPLAKLTVVSDQFSALEQFSSILREELNVKAVDLVEFEPNSLERFGISKKLTVNARAAGPRIGKQVQAAIKAARAGDWEQRGESVVAGGIELIPSEFELQLEAADPANAIAFLADGGFVLLDTVTTPELEAEGLARDLIRAIQDTRKAAGLKVSDRITLSIIGSDATDIESLTTFGETIETETLSVSSSIVLAADAEVEAALTASAGNRRTTLVAGQFSNTGTLVIDLWKASEAVDV